MATIRKVNKTDIPALSALATKTFVDAFGHTFTPHKLAERLKGRSESYFVEVIKNDTILIAEEKDRLIGYVQFGPVEMELDVETSKQDQELKKLYVLSNYQRRGIGKLLIDTALATPQLAKAKNIYLDVWYKNKGAQRLYESFGFKVLDDSTEDLIMIRQQTMG
jgi:ribosomal protein S18 acetylase RimI-like enzyme